MIKLINFFKKHHNFLAVWAGFGKWNFFLGSGKGEQYVAAASDTGGFLARWSSLASWEAA
jgi:hypothetical protein